MVTTFGKEGTDFELTYQAGPNGFYGDLQWRFPFDYSQYVLGQVRITPIPTKVEKGSVIATWNSLNLKPNEEFRVSITVAKVLERSVTSEFKAPTLSSKPKPTQETTANATVQPQVKALGPDYTMIGVVVIAILAAAAYFGFVRKRKSY